MDSGGHKNRVNHRFHDGNLVIGMIRGHKITNYLGLSPLPGFQSPPGLWNIFRLGDPNLNLHLPQASWEGGQPNQLPIFGGSNKQQKYGYFLGFSWLCIGALFELVIPLMIEVEVDLGKTIGKIYLWILFPIVFLLLGHLFDLCF